jgi:hypothetical protein
MDLFRTSRSYRLVVAIVTALTLVPLAIGLIEGFRVGGSALGYAIAFVVSVGFSGIFLGIVCHAYILRERTARRQRSLPPCEPMNSSADSASVSTPSGPLPAPSQFTS